MIEYSKVSATFRGSHQEISALREALAASTEESLETVLATAAPGIAVDRPQEELRRALRSPLFTIELVVSGPGAQQRHAMSIGPHAVGSRWSPLDESSSELSAFPLLTLPGGMTRLVRFRPGTVPGPEQAQQLIPVRGDSLIGLTSADRRSRLDAWDEVSSAIDAVLPPAVDDSWQLVQSRSAWTDPTGAAAGDLAVHLRRGDDHLLVVEEEDGPMLHPVTSLRAWEQMIQVLPDQGDIARPTPGDAPQLDRS